MTEEEVDDLARFRAPPELIEELKSGWQEPAETIVVMRANWPALELFRASLTQWRYAGLGGVPVGLHYPGVESAARMAAIEITPDLFRRLRIMERAALDALEEQAARS